MDKNLVRINQRVRGDIFCLKLKSDNWRSLNQTIAQPKTPKLQSKSRDMIARRKSSSNQFIPSRAQKHMSVLPTSISVKMSDALGVGAGPGNAFGINQTSLGAVSRKYSAIDYT